MAGDPEKDYPLTRRFEGVVFEKDLEDKGVSPFHVSNS